MLYDGSFTYEVVSNRIWVKPNKSGLWMIDLMLKEMLAERHKAYCVIVDLENRPSEEGETIPVAGSSTKVTP